MSIERGGPNFIFLILCRRSCSGRIAAAWPAAAKVLQPDTASHAAGPVGGHRGGRLGAPHDRGSGPSCRSPPEPGGHRQADQEDGLESRLAGEARGGPVSCHVAPKAPPVLQLTLPSPRWSSPWGPWSSASSSTSPYPWAGVLSARRATGAGRRVASGPPLVAAWQAVHVSPSPGRLPCLAVPGNRPCRVHRRSGLSRGSRGRECDRGLSRQEPLIRVSVYRVKKNLLSRRIY